MIWSFQMAHLAEMTLRPLKTRRNKAIPARLTGSCGGRVAEWLATDDGAITEGENPRNEPVLHCFFTVLPVARDRGCMFWQVVRCLQEEDGSIWAKRRNKAIPGFAQRFIILPEPLCRVGFCTTNRPTSDPRHQLGEVVRFGQRGRLGGSRLDRFILPEDGDDPKLIL
jgi:hypothetical protein